MKLHLKKLKDQVIVVTGATSGIGLVTARHAARQGAKLVLVARNEDALRRLVDEVVAAGSEAAYVVADVANETELRRAAETARQRFGGFDTWVNNAGVTIYGKVNEVSTADHRRLFETNFWGLVNGSRIAVEELRTRGGALINVGSTLSDRAIPLQGMYSASKHAVKGFTDALRMEVEEEGLPISVTLIKPAAIDTPYRQHAKNYLGVEPMNPPPVYAPEIVAAGILHAAQKPERDLFIGSAGKAMSAAGQYAPRLTDKIMERNMFKIQYGKGPPAPADSLYGPSEDLSERGGYPGMVRETSYYTRAAMHPAITGLLALGLGAALALIVAGAGTQRGRQTTRRLTRRMRHAVGA